MIQINARCFSQPAGFIRATGAKVDSRGDNIATNGIAAVVSNAGAAKPTITRGRCFFTGARARNRNKATGCPDVDVILTNPVGCHGRAPGHHCCRERLDPRMLANEPVFVRYRDVEVPGWFPHQVKRLGIYLELVVRGVVAALHCWNFSRTSRTDGCMELCSRHLGAM